MSSAVMLVCLDATDPYDVIPFEKMYKDYYKEISVFFKHKPLEMGGKEWRAMVDNYEDPRSYRIYLVYGPENVIVGFVVLGFGNNTNPDTDYYIAEFYIAPEYRCRKYGQATVKELFKKHSGVYCYFVLKSNTKAKSFWDNTRIALRCAPMEHRIVCSVDSGDCDFYAFYDTHS